MCKICSVCVGVRRGAACLCHTAEGACPSQDSQTCRDGGYVPNDEYIARTIFIPRTEMLCDEHFLRRASGFRRSGTCATCQQSAATPSLQRSPAK